MVATGAVRREAAVTDAIATTAKGLKAALASGAAHIEIQAHLDFTQHGEGPGAQGRNTTVLVVPPSVKSIRVRPHLLCMARSHSLQHHHCFLSMLGHPLFFTCTTNNFVAGGPSSGAVPLPGCIRHRGSGLPLREGW